MNLWLRLLYFVLSGWWRKPITSPDEASLLTFRVSPLDLDVSLHMNNGRYLTLMDIGRLDFLVRSSLWRAVVRNRWTPIASAISIRYRRELMPFAKFQLETRLVYWSEASVIMEQVFVLRSGRYAGQVAARALFKGGIYSRTEKSFVDIARLMREIGVTATSPPASEEVAAFLKADATLKIASAARDSAPTV